MINIKGLMRSKRLSWTSALSTFVVLISMLGGVRAEAAITTLYITDSSGYNIPGDAATTNLPAGNNSDNSATNGSYDTLFSTTAPTSSNTAMRDTYTTAGTYYTIGRVYYNTSFATDATILANVVGKFSLRSSTTSNDKFEFILRDYDPTAGSGANGSAINTITNVSSPGTTTTLVTVNFTNANYTLPAGHYLELEIRFNPSVNNNYGRVYCNSSNASYLNVGIQFPIAASAVTANGSISAPGMTTVTNSNSPQTISLDYQSSKVFTVTPSAGYKITQVLVDGASQAGAVGQTSAWTYTFSSINRSHTISASFDLQTANLSISVGAHGTIATGATTWTPGTYTWTNVLGTYTFNVTPDPGYAIQKVFVNTVDQGIPLGQTTTASVPVTLTGSGSPSISATFVQLIAVTSSAGPGGTIDPLGTTYVPSGGSITFDITADSGYRILAITDNGVNVPTPSSTYTISNVTAAHNIVVTFQHVYHIVAMAGPNGSVSPIGDVLVDAGSSRNFTIAANVGFRIFDVLVDDVSIGVASSYNFTNVAADHTISATFETTTQANTYCAIPPFITTAAPPNVMLMLSVETPMQGPANPSVTTTGTASDINFSASTSASLCSVNAALGCYTNGNTYYGYFESGKCYSYTGSGSTGLFSPYAAATNHQCDGSHWSGNFLNWMSTAAVDAFRKAFTGGNRTVDTATDTVLLGARIDSNGWFPDKVYVDNAELYTPYSGTRYFYRKNVGIGFGVCNSLQTACTVTSTGSGESLWPVAGANTQAVFSLRIKACDSTGGAESRCNSANNKPEGTIQKNMDKIRFGLMSYVKEDTTTRDGGVLRSNMKWVGPKIPYGLISDTDATRTPCNTSTGCTNPEAEVSTDGTFVDFNPSNTVGYQQGIINYINKFGYLNGYKQYDPVSEMFYEVVRYFRNQKPSDLNYCNGLSTTDFAPATNPKADGFAYYCDATSKTSTWSWRDPQLYPCSQNFVIAVNDANPHRDKRIPGGPFTADYGGEPDWCGSSQGACDSDFKDNGVQVDVEAWTNAVGDKEGLTGKTISGACEVNDSHTGCGAYGNVTISKLGRVIQSSRQNSYLVAGLAYYAHMVDLRPDLNHCSKTTTTVCSANTDCPSGERCNKRVHNLTTFMIDTQEPASSMSVGPRNMLYLAAKYGGFNDKDNDQSVTIGGVNYNSPYTSRSATSPKYAVIANDFNAEWTNNTMNYPDNYFFASKAADVENSLNTAFSSILDTVSSGTAAAVANNKSGERGANIIQALFYPQWRNDKNIKWLGEVQGLWYYLDPIINFSGVYADTDLDTVLDLTKDKPPGDDPFLTNALWKAGVELHKRTTARNVYSLLSTSTKVLTDANNAFTAGNVSTIKPLLNVGAMTDTNAQTLINYILGTDTSTYRSRTVTNGGLTACWKLGDVIDSTPQIQSAIPTNSYHQLYGDSEYKKFINSRQYQANNIVYAGANDGMLHAFRLGQVQKLNDSVHPFKIAQIVDDTDLGKEEWAFIPQNAMPYLKNQAEQNYCHQYLVDGAPLLIEASIKRHSECTASNYWDCLRQTKLVGGAGADKNDYVAAKTSWQAVLLGSMGLGGASRDGNCNETLNHDANPANNTDCVKTPPGITNADYTGFSSYFALDVTDPLAPKQMWEFSDSVLPAADRGIGLTAPGPVIVRINAKTGATADKTKNGRWFAVFASGPTGRIDSATRQFLGRSDQDLRIYVVDLNPFDTVSTFTKCTSAGQTSCNYWVFDPPTPVKFAFANSLNGSAVDLDRSDSNLNGYYSDDVVYITYTRATLDGDDYPVDWNKGGILRLVTKNDPDPANWFVSTLIDGIGPVTTAIGKLQDRNNKKLWVFFGEGRYFFVNDNLTDTRRIFGIADPCYNYDLAHINTLSTDSAKCPAISVNSDGTISSTILKDQSLDSAASSVLTTEKGWYITLDAAAGSVGAERLVSDVTAAANGIVFYTTYIPSSDLCSNGGNSSMWAVRYNTGGTPPTGGLKGKAPLQTSSGGISIIDLGTAFTQRGGRKLDAYLEPPGEAPKGRFPPLLLPKPARKILNIQER